MPESQTIREFAARKVIAIGAAQSAIKSGRIVRGAFGGYAPARPAVVALLRLSRYAQSDRCEGLGDKCGGQGV